MHETEWMRHNPRPRNVQHGQRLRRPMTPRRATGITLTIAPFAFAAGWLIATALGGSA